MTNQMKVDKNKWIIELKNGSKIFLSKNNEPEIHGAGAGADGCILWDGPIWKIREQKLSRLHRS